MRIKNQKSFDKKQLKIKLERERRLSAAANFIQGLTLKHDFYARSESDLAWMLRRAGSLGKHDRLKERYDQFTDFSEEALELALSQNLVKVKKCATGVRLVQAIEYETSPEAPPPLLDMNFFDPVDVVCDPSTGRFTHLRRGSSSLHELKAHA